MFYLLFRVILKYVLQETLLKENLRDKKQYNNDKKNKNGKFITQSNKIFMFKITTIKETER